MRSKEVEEAIGNVHQCINTSQYPDDDDMETVLAYISELEKEIERIKSVDIYKLVEDADTGQLLHKDKIRDKIKELEKELDEFEKTDNSGRFKREKSRDYDKVEILKELLGE